MAHELEAPTPALRRTLSWTRSNLSLNSSVHRIIVGVDYGTTYTGMCWVPSSADPRITAIYPIQNWGNDVACKTPSRIAYRTDNDWLAADQWGFGVTPKMKSFSWTKLLLYSGASDQEIDDPSLGHDTTPFETGLLKLPPGKSAADVAIDYLREVYKFFLAQLLRKMDANTLAETTLEFWFSVPAIWIDKSKAETKRIAMAAGFGSRPGDRIYLIAEPEAAAIATLKNLSQTGLRGFLEAGDNILICDCGGGTVDLTAYTILSVSPSMRFRELLVGAGGRCGSTYIDRQFLSWMVKTFGTHFTKLGREKTGPGSRFMKEFETFKKDFGNSFTDEFQLTLNMPEVNDSDNYDAGDKIVRFYESDMVQFFRPAIHAIKTLIKSQLDLVQGDMKTQIKKIFLVGGFGDSVYLKRELDYWCNSRYPQVTITQPQDPQSAIMKGAALRGHLGLRPEERICRRHYGFACAKPFRKGKDQFEDSYIELWTQARYVKNRVDWVARKWQDMTDHTVANFPISHIVDSARIIKGREDLGTHSDSLTLWSCSGEDAPDHITEGIEAIGKIHFNVDIKASDVQSKIFQGRRIWKVNYCIEMRLSPQEGHLVLRMLHEGVERGTASIHFNDG